MCVTEKVDNVYKRLKNDLNNIGIEITNDKGAANMIILALSEAYGEGKEIGKSFGRAELFREIDSMKKGYIV